MAPRGDCGWGGWVRSKLIKRYDLGQIIATSHDLFSPQMVVKSKGTPLISGKSRLVKYYNLARYDTERGVSPLVNVKKHSKLDRTLVGYVGLTRGLRLLTTLMGGRIFSVCVS